ncbi:MAG: BrnA antitoxin family protein [Fibrobacteres bacterium]|nr:BrnA antitoxin family protein [Fibrobacterota bacterium]
MKKTLKSIPNFKTDQEAANFWDKHDATEFFDYSKAKRVVFPNLKPSTETISIRLPTSLLDGIKNQANKNDVPYQSYLKMILSEKLQEVINSLGSSSTVHSLRTKHGRA